jgi:predicted Zn-dependent peptidase
VLTAFSGGSATGRAAPFGAIFGYDTHEGFDYVDKYPRYIRNITAEDIARVARKYLDSENYTLVVVGPVNGNDK